MTTLTARRCQRHPAREAVARCPVCSGFFCRECVVEHDDSIICSTCLAAIETEKKTSHSTLAWLPGLLGASLGLAMLSVLFYTMGKVLVSTPSSFHEGTVWSKSLLDDSANPEDASDAKAEP